MNRCFTVSVTWWYPQPLRLPNAQRSTTNVRRSFVGNGIGPLLSTVVWFHHFTLPRPATFQITSTLSSRTPMSSSWRLVVMP